MDDTPLIHYEPRCPGCMPEFDSRIHQEVWCWACRPEPPAPDNSRARVSDLIAVVSDTDPVNQRAIADLLRQDAEQAAQGVDLVDPPVLVRHEPGRPRHRADVHAELKCHGDDMADVAILHDQRRGHQADPQAHRQQGRQPDGQQEHAPAAAARRTQGLAGNDAGGVGADVGTV